MNNQEFRSANVEQASYQNNKDNVEVIDLMHYWKIISAYKWSILGFTILMTVLVALVVFSLTPIYTATTTLLIESEKENVVSIQEVYGIPGANDKYFETQNRILQSRNLAERVINKINIAQHYEYDTKQKQKTTLESLLSIFTQFFP